MLMNNGSEEMRVADIIGIEIARRLTASSDRISVGESLVISMDCILHTTLTYILLYLRNLKPESTATVESFAINMRTTSSLIRLHADEQWV